jgi:hypothetical protein
MSLEKRLNLRNVHIIIKRLMNEIYEEENCLNYDKSDRPQMEIIRLHKGEKGSMEPECHVMCFFLEGSARFESRDFPGCEVFRMQALFLPAESYYSYEALRDMEVIVLRLLEPAKLCKDFHVEASCNTRRPDTAGNGKAEEMNGFRLLNIHPALRDFLSGIHRSLTDGIRCRRYFELNVELLFILLRCYYPKDKLYDLDRKSVV